MFRRLAVCASVIALAAALPALAQSFYRGDANCDDVIDNGDIDGFVLALGGRSAYEAAFPSCPFCVCDVNGDGSVDNGDIDPFVAALLSQNPTAQATPCIDLDGDNDRNGRVDGTDAEDRIEETQAALVLANYDDDDPAPIPPAVREVDNADASITAAGDLEDLAYLRIRPVVGVPNGWTVTLKIDAGPDGGAPAARQRVRVFEVNPIVGSIEIIGPTTGDEAVLNAGALINGAEIGVEGIEFARSVMLQLSLKDGTGAIRSFDKVLMKVAPWLALPNNAQVNETIACTFSRPGNNLRFIGAFSAADNVFTNVLQPDECDNDRWGQDKWEIGYSRVPGLPQEKVMTIFLNLPRKPRGADKLHTAPRDLFVGNGVGVYNAPGNRLAENGLEYGGNIDCSGPVTVGGTAYPVGRLIFGDDAGGLRRMQAPLRAFFDRQGVQSPVVVQTSWLAVGHVDELICVVPDHSTADRRDFEVLLGDPATALASLQLLRLSGAGDYRLMHGRAAMFELTVADVLTPRAMGGPGILEYNQTVVQPFIDETRTRIRNGLNIPNAKITSIPALWVPASYFFPAAAMAYVVPSSSDNTGTATLTLLEGQDIVQALSPHEITEWEIVFTSSTQYEVYTSQFGLLDTPQLDGSGTVFSAYYSGGVVPPDPTALTIPPSAWTGSPEPGDWFSLITGQEGAAGLPLADRACAFFPAMQNAQVANSHLLVPDPFGPRAAMLVFGGAVAANGTTVTVTMNGTTVTTNLAAGQNAAAVAAAVRADLNAAGFTSRLDPADATKVVITRTPRRRPMSTVTIATDDAGLAVGGIVTDDPLQSYYTVSVAPLLLTPHFIDNFDPYHRKAGQIHCGTNRLSSPFSEAGARWWLQAGQ